jgi:hypothetical protein
VTDFYLDDGVAQQLADELVVLGHTATTSQAEGQKGAHDEVHFWLAAQRGWTVITHNREDFRMLHRAWRLWSVAITHAGVLIIPQTSTGLAFQAAQTIDLFLRAQPSLVNMLYEHRPSGWRVHS